MQKPPNARKTRTRPTRISRDPVTAYARDVVAGKIVAGPLVRGACKRHLDDLKHGKKRGLRFDRKAALHVIGFFRDVLRLPDGDKAGEPFELDRHQQFIIGSLFGWKNADGHRRFRIAYIEEAKGNGKSPLAAGVGIYMTSADGEQNAEVYAAATTRDQAHICFQDAVKMREQSPALIKRLRTSGIEKITNLTHMKSGSFFRPVAAEGRGLDGKRVHCAIIDEVHEHPTEVVVEKLRAGTKGRAQALILMITNSGYDRETVCYRWHDYGRRAITGEIEDKSTFDHVFFYICSLDEDDDWTDEACWSKANPNLDVSVTRQYLRELVSEAIDMPSKQGIVKRLNFCQWTESFTPWISHPVWAACQHDLSLDDYLGRQCYGGLDLSMARDLTALALDFPMGKKRHDLFVFFWTPADTLRERAEADGKPYLLWAEQGFLITTPGKVVDYDWVATQLIDVLERFNLIEVAFDEYRIPYLEKALADRNATVPMVKHPQGYRKSADSGLWMPQSVRELEDAVLEKRARFQRSPVLSWNAASVVTESDAQGNRKFAKHKVTGKIDGIVACAQAIGAATAVPEEDDVDLDDFLNNAVMT